MKEKPLKIQILRGMKDILPDEAVKWRYVENAALSLFSAYGYKEIRTPVMEERSLFERSIGSATDIVQKEMYVLTDRGGRDIALRPEGTASIARAYIEHNLAIKEGFVKLFYMGPMFRGERPQAGRQRQFHQIGAEAVGSASPYVDVEIISLLVRLLEALKLKDFKLHINNLGCFKDRVKIKDELREILKREVSRLCDDCKERIIKNPLRVLDCKNESCGQLTRELPNTFGKHMCQDCRAHFEKVKEALCALKIPFQIDPKMVRGLDYYTRTGFEVTHPALGSKDAIGAGGRYDSLVADFGGPETGACGFALGTERLLMAMENSGAKPSGQKRQHPVYIATLGEASFKKGFELLDLFRKSDIHSDIDYEGKSLKAQMRTADKKGAEFVIIIGDEELKKSKVLLRDMKSQKQKPLEISKITKELKRILNA